MYCLWRSHGFPLRFLFLLPLLRFVAVLYVICLCALLPLSGQYILIIAPKLIKAWNIAKSLNLLRSVKVPPKTVPHILCNVTMKVSKFFKNEFSFKGSTNSTLNRMASWGYLSRMGCNWIWPPGALGPPDPEIKKECGKRRRQLWQHWFIQYYIRVYIGGMYMCTDRVYAGTRGGEQNGSPQGSPRALASAGRRRGQRSILWGGVCWRCGYRGGFRSGCCGGFRCGGFRCGGFRCCRAVDGASGPGRAKTSALGRKTVPGPFRSGVVEGVEAKGCANDTRLAAAEPFGRSAAAESPGRLPGGRPRRREGGC